MKKIALAITALVISFSSMAQTTDSASTGHREYRKMERHAGGQYLEKLNLTEDQKAQIKTLNEGFRQQMQDLKNNAGSSADQKEKRDALMKEHHEKVEAILTPEQRKQAQDMRKEFAHGNKKGEMRNERFDEMTKNLNLTPDQATKMKDLSASLRNNMQSIHQNTALSQEEKKEQMKSLMKKHKADMEAILTNEQKEQLKNNYKNRRNEAVK